MGDLSERSPVQTARGAQCMYSSVVQSTVLLVFTPTLTQGQEKRTLNIYILTCTTRVTPGYPTLNNCLKLSSQDPAAHTKYWWILCTLVRRSYKSVLYTPDKGPVCIISSPSFLKESSATSWLINGFYQIFIDGNKQVILPSLKRGLRNTTKDNFFFP